MDLTQILKKIFAELQAINYAWRPVTPEELLQYRKNPEAFDPLTQKYGLGLGTPQAPFAISTFKQYNTQFFVPHSHWPAQIGQEENYVHLGAESFLLIENIKPFENELKNKNILDLGCSSGVLSFYASLFAKKVLGIDSCAQAIEWANATAIAQNIKSTEFKTGKIGSHSADAATPQKDWEVVIFNPPFTVPTPGAEHPHRDGGKTGTELPLAFLDFAHNHLLPNGTVFCLTSNPIVQGRGLFFDRLSSKKWKIKTQKRLHTHFNQKLYRKENYAEQGIERVELYFLHLTKQSGNEKKNPQ